MGTTVLLLVILILNIVLWVILFIRLRKEFSPDTVLYSIRDEVDKLIIEINRVADRDITLIEARRNGLMQLLEEIDKKLSLHGHINQTRDKEKMVISQLLQMEQKPTESVPKEGNETLPLDPVVRAAAVYKKNEIQDINTEPDNPESTIKEEEPIHITFSSDPISPKQDKRRSVIKMSKEGFSSEMIAEKLKISVREVSLIIDLYT